MKSMKEVFDLPVSPDDFSDAFYPNEDNQDEYAAHAINCHDELVSTLQYCLENIKGTPLALKVGRVIAKARGE